ncbi:hypothetical protein B0A49_12091 [Cryomyces minteri]|uniref:DUF7784 domain-containing protein n=1 Tax=Cryomyces minteri TaxID=331657 RepID=A0A4U0VPZ2_9PEZI|nr:hypothetical protein B0A49_12091 [Cryomyces minteri]
MDDLRRLIISSIRRLDEQLVLRDKIVTPYRHQEIGDNICRAAQAFKIRKSSISAFTDAVLTVSYVKAYFNSSTPARQLQYNAACPAGQNSLAQVCQVPDQSVAPNPAGRDGNTTAHTYFFTQHKDMTVNQTVYAAGTAGKGVSAAPPRFGLQAAIASMAMAVAVAIVSAVS